MQSSLKQCSKKKKTKKIDDRKETSLRETYKIKITSITAECSNMPVLASHTNKKIAKEVWNEHEKKIFERHQEKEKSVCV